MHRNSIAEEDVDIIEIYLKSYSVAFWGEYRRVPVNVFFIVANSNEASQHIVTEFLRERSFHSGQNNDIFNLNWRGGMLNWHAAAFSVLYIFDLSVKNFQLVVVLKVGGYDGLFGTSVKWHIVGRIAETEGVYQEMSLIVSDLM